MVAQFDKKDEGSDDAGKVEQEVCVFMIVCPLHPFGRLMRKGRQKPVKIITADAGEKNEPEEIVRIRKPQHMAGLPGH